MTFIKEAIDFLVKIGLLDVILPFILSFSISYGILEKNKILGENKNINAVVSFVIGFMIVGMINIVDIINQAIGIFVLVVFTVLFMLIITKFLFKDWQPGRWPLFLGFLFLIGIGLFLFWELINWGVIVDVVYPWIPIVAFFLIFLLIINFIREKKPEKHVEKKGETSENRNLRKVGEFTPKGRREIG